MIVHHKQCILGSDGQALRNAVLKLVALVDIGQQRCGAEARVSSTNSTVWLRKSA
jgi:hypothetical protein